MRQAFEQRGHQDLLDAHPGQWLLKHGAVGGLGNDDFLAAKLAFHSPGKPAPSTPCRLAAEDAPEVAPGGGICKAIDHAQLVRIMTRYGRLGPTAAAVP